MPPRSIAYRSNLIVPDLLQKVCIFYVTGGIPLSKIKIKLDATGATVVTPASGDGDNGSRTKATGPAHKVSMLIKYNSFFGRPQQRPWCASFFG
jgi:hypothetical protein